MTALDWTVFFAYLLGIVWLGVRANRAGRSGAEGGQSADEFLLAGRGMPWWAIGLSVMATQASAITFIGTTGKAFTDGMGFAQFYLGLPVAMVILAYTLLPLYHRAKVTTAYEFLGQRFDGRVRLATALLFLASRGLALGVVIYAPSVVLSLLLGWDTVTTVASMTLVAVAYTMVGGLRAVIWTDVVQMVLIFGGLFLCVGTMVSGLPAGVTPRGLFDLAEATGRTQLLDWSLDPGDRYTVWSGLLGGTFLFLAYFGCDQSQVQRLLAARSLKDGRRALALNGIAKLPIQLFVLTLGVLLFGVLQFDDDQPILFDARGGEAVIEAGLGAEWGDLQARHAAEVEARHLVALAPARAGWDMDVWQAREANVEALRAEARELVARAGVEDFDDTNHVFPWWVLHHLPVGVVGLLIAAIFAAAMSSIDSELNALATTTAVDVWQRHVDEGADLVRVARGATLVWGALAALFAVQAAALGSVIEAVNQVGSWFYGSLLGVFVLAVAFTRVDGRGALFGLIAGMASVAIAGQAGLAWLWLNPIACIACVLVGLVTPRSTRPTP